MQTAIENPQSKITQLDLIENLAREYAALRATLAERVADLEAEFAQLRKRRIGGIKSAAALAEDTKAQLVAAVAAAPECFVQPRTLTLHGIKVGFQKGKGRIAWDDDARVIELIRRHLPDQAEVLIRTREEPVRDGLKQLSVADLRRLGCTVEEAGDQVYIRAADTEVDKLVAKLLAEGAQEGGES